LNFKEKSQISRNLIGSMKPGKTSKLQGKDRENELSRIILEISHFLKGDEGSIFKESALTTRNYSSQ
jgi:hypothetical protein